MATPAQVRRELKKMGVSISIVKREGFWYVDSEEPLFLEETCLHTRYFHGAAFFWADIIRTMQEKGKVPKY
jgi:hypothetical protein